MIKIYVQELATYNNAIGLGRWVAVEDFNKEIESIFEEATELLKSAGYYYGVDTEEYEIVDWECDIDGINLDSCYQDIDKLKELNEILLNSSEDELEKIKYLLYEGHPIKDITSDVMDDIYIYDTWDETIEDFVELYLEVPEDSKLYNYIDYSRVQRDLEMEGFSEYHNKIFKNNN